MTPEQIRKSLPELCELESLIEKADSGVRSSVLTQIPFQDSKLPLYALEMGSSDEQAPALGLIGGVHGVERIGSQVILAYLGTLIERMKWDESVHQQLRNLKLFFIPIANPGGMWNNSRCNPNGVDLMRNAPIEAQDKTPLLLGGHRISRHLPWHRGRRDGQMEPELQALHDYVTSQALNRPLTLTLDCHSGFGFTDRIWFPYAGRFKPISDLAVVYRLYHLFSTTFRNHKIYKFEPQAHSYTTHGDVWDLLYDHSLHHFPQSTFIPLTLEMGSWLWVKKNPRQLFNYVSLFNPILPHRHSRILRRHYPLLEFLVLATRAYQSWLPHDTEQLKRDTRAAMKRWYSNAKGKG